jgi:ATP diphosphatase
MPKLSILDDICDECTALERGQRLGERAATVGFDWPEAAQALEKVHEEVAELEQALGASVIDREDVASELGDVLFALVNVARKLGIDAEQAMERTNRKFAHRFRFIEDEIACQGRQLDDVELDEMEALWQLAKD